MRLRFLTAVLLLCLTSAAWAVSAPHLVKDINTVPSPSDSSPSGFVTAGSVSYFVADDGDTGRELWRTDGTTAGTYQLADICPGECSSGPAYYAIAGSSYFFRAVSKEFGRYDLWVSRGTPASTLRLTSEPAVVAPDDDYQRRWVSSLGIFFFLASDFDHGSELWRTDGTPAGTYRVADLWPGPGSSRPREMTELNGRLYFVADDGVHGPMLWKSDGTAAGTVPVRDPVPNSATHEAPVKLRAVGHALYFVAPAPGKGIELWKSNGTTRGTAPLVDLTPGPASTQFYDLTVLGDRLYFVADAGTGQELWTSNGTAAGTRALTQLSPPDAFFSTDPLDAYLPPTAVGGRFAFAANDGVHGTELWKTDGTPQGTAIVKDVCPGACSGTYFAAPLGNRLVFLGTTPALGQEPWITDGTTGGTRLLRDLCPGVCSSYLYKFAWDLGGRVVFAVNNPGGQQAQLWSSNGTTAGTVPVATFSKLSFEYTGMSTALLGNRIVFVASEPGHGIEPWVSDGTVQGTTLLADINHQDLGGSYPAELNAVGSSVFFFAGDAAHGAELWKSDGSRAGTSLVRDLVPGPDSPAVPFPLPADQAGGRLFFVLGGNGELSSLWRSDGTDAGTMQVTQPGAPQILMETGVRSAGGTVFFVATDEDHGYELWKTDGTPAGTRLVKDIEPGPEGSSPERLTSFQGRLYFSAQTSTEGRELWVSDGTEAGTRLVKNITEGGTPSNPVPVGEHAGRLWFDVSNGGDVGESLWSTDGTPAGTAREDLTPATGVFTAEKLVSAGNRFFVFGGAYPDFGLWSSDGTVAGTRFLSTVRRIIDPFVAADPILYGGSLVFAGWKGSEHDLLWKSDGTEAGTGLLLDRDGQLVVGPRSFRVLGGLLFFTTRYDGALWRTDGTPAGTFRVRNRLQPFGNANAVKLVPAGNHLFFPSFDRGTGTELWAIDGN